MNNEPRDAAFKYVQKLMLYRAEDKCELKAFGEQLSQKMLIQRFKAL